MVLEDQSTTEIHTMSKIKPATRILIEVTMIMPAAAEVATPDSVLQEELVFVRKFGHFGTLTERGGGLLDGFSSTISTQLRMHYYFLLCFSYSSRIFSLLGHRFCGIWFRKRAISWAIRQDFPFFLRGDIISLKLLAFLFRIRVS
jgi:hypothetical protein